MPETMGLSFNPMVNGSQPWELTLVAPSFKPKTYSPVGVQLRAHLGFSKPEAYVVVFALLAFFVSLVFWRAHHPAPK